MNTILIPILFAGLLNPKADKFQFFIGPSYSSYLLYQDEEEEKETRQWGVQTGFANIIPKLGIKFTAASVRYDAPVELGPYSYKYTPLTITLNYNLLPFLKTGLIQINLETGLGWYLWRGLYENEVITLPTGEKMDEKDLGFTGGLELQIKPLNNLGIVSNLQYHYLTSSNIYKYGYFDKDEKLLVNGIGLRLFIR
jgi:hypothetical protein